MNHVMICGTSLLMDTVDSDRKETCKFDKTLMGMQHGITLQTNHCMYA